MDVLIVLLALAVADLPAGEAQLQTRLQPPAQGAVGAYAANTARAVASGTKIFAAGRGASPLPASPGRSAGPPRRPARWTVG